MMYFQLLGVGSTFFGIMEGCAKNLEEILAAPEDEAARAKAIAGLVGHIREEQLEPSARHMRDVVAQNVPYAGK